MNIQDITKQIRAFADELDAVKAPEKPNDSPPWIEHKGGPCPLNDDEVEEFQIKYDYGDIYDYDIPPSTLHSWENTGRCHRIEAYRVIKAREPAPKQPLGPQDIPPGSVLEEELQLNHYAELKAAHAAGKVIQLRNVKRGRLEWMDIKDPAWNFNDEGDEYRIKPDDSPPWIKWHGGECPLDDEDVENFEYIIRNGMTSSIATSPSLWRWTHGGNPGDIIAYRVLKARTPTPKQLLGPQDVPPGSVLLSSTAGVNGMQWTCVHCVKARGVKINGRDCITWAELKKHWKINRPRHRDENGNPTLWEACER